MRHEVIDHTVINSRVSFYQLKEAVLIPCLFEVFNKGEVAGVIWHLQWYEAFEEFKEKSSYYIIYLYKRLLYRQRLLYR